MPTFFWMLLTISMLMENVSSAKVYPMPDAIEIRLLGGPDSSQGRVEIRSADGNPDDNAWGTICNDQYEVDNKAATVICRQLGYLWGEGTANGVFGSGPKSQAIWLDEVMCNGSETSLGQCVNSGWGQHNCYHIEDVGAICHNNTVRLQSEFNKGNVGVVQVMYDYKWGDACDTNWTDVSATIVCKELGFVYGVAECCSSLGPSDFSNVDKSFKYSCSGVEQNLTECTNTSYRGMCSYSHRASVVCHNVSRDQVKMEFGIRLVDGDDNWGRVEVRHSGVWGQICNTRWEEAAANVTCRQLGQGFIGGIPFGPVTTPEMPTWLMSVKCTGNESSIENCKFTQWGEPLVFACNPAYVLCYKTGVQVDIVNGTVPSSGRVQISYDGVPGSICASEEWTDNDAFLVCRMKGYSYGVVKTPSGSSANVPPYYMNKLICNTLRDIFMCSSSGWKRSVDQCALSAHVSCYKDIRLTDGNENAGIVEFIDNDKWVGFCNDGFTPEHAGMICKELGHQNGTLLPPGAYGKYYKQLGRPYIKCTGNQTTIMDCDYNKQVACSASLYNYVSICCHENETDKGPRFQLVGNDPEPSFGRVDVYLHHIWGEICSDGWTDTEADVYCRTLGRGFRGGVAVYYYKRQGLPNLVSEIKCLGNETNFKDCVIKPYFVCQSSQRAGVVCYKESAPTISLVDGGKNYGRVQVSSDDVTGSVCDVDWTETEASVVCREINVNFTQGEPFFDLPASSNKVLLENFRCSGLEKSLMKCSNAGWRTVLNKQCYDGSHEVGVYCYGKVRLMNGKHFPDIISGQVEILPSAQSGDGSDWLAVCGDNFDQTDAEVVCREMGFDAAKVLAPGSFGVEPVWKFYTNMTCKAGGRDVHADCSYEKGRCSKATHNHASVQCYKSTLNPDTKYYIENGKHGKVVVEQYGINGTICDAGWDDNDADVLCRSKGYKGGVALGVPEIYTRTETVWFTKVACESTSKNSDFAGCPKKDSVPIECTMSLKAAGVLCYEKEVRVELVNDKNKSYYGRVEIVYDNIRGTICDYEWSTYDAQVTCRQLGFPGGQAYKRSYYGGGNDSVVLAGMTCDNSESTILSCPNSGWERMPSTCLDHKRDASVKCKRNVLTDEADNYGVVKVYANGTYHLLCDDAFDGQMATWVCRSMGYYYGEKLCCSAFGQQKFSVGVARMNCLRTDTKFSHCDTNYNSRCSSGSEDYASVVCFNEVPEEGFNVDLEEFKPGMGSGPVLIVRSGVKGYMCAENYDDADANVICKQRGFMGGYAYKYYNEDVRMGATRDLRWMRGPDCNGTEHRLDMCPGINLRNVSDCFVLSHAAAFCYNLQEQSEFDVRIVNAPHPDEGFVQVKVNGTWGSVCTSGTLISNFEATVICRQLKFKYGVVIPIPDFEALNGTVWMSNINCVGSESTLRECLLSGMGDEISATCNSHQYDLAVKCYANVRVSASSTPNFGMVQVLNETANRWVSVCDTDFDDVDARIACQNIGYKDGKAQCCSSLGEKLTFYNPIEVADVRCAGNETDFSKCPHKMGPNVTCPSGQYASMVCTDESPPTTSIEVAVADDQLFGNIKVKRFGVWGSVCDVGWDDNDARVVCKELGFVTGYATNGTNNAEMPMILNDVNCTGTESRLEQCSFPSLNEGTPCNRRLTRAAVVCSQYDEPVQHRVADVSNGRGRAEIYFDGRWGTICDRYWEDKDADVFCKQTGHLGGSATSLIVLGDVSQPIWMSHVECTGREANFLQCRASWDAKTLSRCSHYDQAGVKCFKSARLNRGDYRTKQSYGILEIFVPSNDQDNNWATVCADSFTDKEAEVACRVLGHEHGLSTCCSPYGYNTLQIAPIQPKCNGTEKHMTDCEYVKRTSSCSRQNFASITCYNGTRTQTSYSLSLKGSLKYTGQVVLNYLDVPGRICWNNWSDEDARVVCRELGYKNGSAYYHYKSSFIYLDYNGPYWTSNAQCIGNETQLSECVHAGFGNVEQCDDRGHYAGVICFDETDIAYRINGGDSRYGRVEFTYDGDWHTICSNTWGTEESNVTCRQLGFVTGETFSGEYVEPPSGKAYSINYRCKGDEANLNDCPHEGFQEATYCQDHKSDEGVFCYTSVKLTGPTGVTSGNGSVLAYINDTWSFICDEGFDDVTARKVCKELGFADGRAICCSAFGAPGVFGFKLSNYSMNCNGDEDSIQSCLYQTNCSSQRYASAVCLKSSDIVNEDSYSFSLEKEDQGQLEVTHLGVKGRICSRDWDDKEATVYCRSIGFPLGAAYQHSEDNVLSQKRGPYLLGGFNCTGNESSLMACPHLNRTNLDNCTDYDIASVLCFNESGIEYRLGGGGDNYGRVEISVGGTWGTVCDQSWDKREAGVFCRQFGFTDGEASGGAHFGMGEGPIWISHLKCKGTEDKLHQCPHRGFANDFSFDWWFPLPCETHSDDAGVFCYKSVRLNKGPSSNAGGIEIHKDGKWYGICDTGFDRNAALVTCRSIKKTYIDALPIQGSAYGNLSGVIGFSNVQCKGDEADLTNCTMDFNASCDSGYYMSVFCSNTTLENTELQVRIHPDSLASNVHGIVEVRVNSVWGKVCLHEFDDRDAAVICRSLGYDGGISYLHIMRNDKPILMRDVQCLGNETSLSQCPNKQMSPDLQHCNYGSDDAGVICYNNTESVGFEYRLAGGAKPSTGRVEIGYAGHWGMVCAWSWQSADARVLCRALGHVDGIVEYTVNKSLPYSVPWVTGFFCRGVEASPMTCLNTGFNSSFLTDLCLGGKDPGAYSSCYDVTVEPTNIRLVDGPNKFSGRVEVFVTGVNSWGTICDDYWDEDDAVVVCKHLGFYGGTPLRKAPFGSGTGPIWFDNMKCKGDEKTLFECSHRGIGTHNCNHTEDVGVVCLESPPTTEAPKSSTTAVPPPKTTSSTTPSTTTTTTTTTAKTTPQTKKPPPPTTTIKTTTTAKTTTVKSTTTKSPPTFPPITTQKTTPTTTEKRTTERKTTHSTKSTTSSVKTSTTTANMTESTDQARQQRTSTTNLGVALAVPLVILMLVIVVIALVVLRIKRRKVPSGYSRESFDDSAINREPDGTINASNQLYDLNMQPTSSISPNSLEEEDDNMMFGRNGNAYYSKGLSNGESAPGAFTNPLYDVNRDTEIVAGQNGMERSLPSNGEISFNNLVDPFDDAPMHNSSSNNAPVE